VVQGVVDVGRFFTIKMGWRDDDDDGSDQDSDEYIPDEDGKDDEFVLKSNQQEEEDDDDDDEDHLSDVGHQVSVRELEQDTTTMFQEQGELFHLWPLITICELDRKLPTKLKKVDYEPNWEDACIGNISMLDRWEGQVERMEDVEGLKWTHDDEFIVTCLVDHFKLDRKRMKQEYATIKQSLFSTLSHNPSFIISLPLLRHLSPTTDILVLNQCMTMMDHLDVFQLEVLVVD
jgi:hypothetical protein